MGLMYRRRFAHVVKRESHARHHLQLNILRSSRDMGKVLSHSSATQVTVLDGRCCPTGCVELLELENMSTSTSSAAWLRYRTSNDAVRDRWVIRVLYFHSHAMKYVYILLGVTLVADSSVATDITSCLSKVSRLQMYLYKIPQKKSFHAL